jgi:mannose/fructose/N-acetylgalactosamine-specific phosphotransferase system component IID
MEALKELFGTAVGLMSLAVIIGVIVIGAYIGRWINRQIEQDEARQRR